MKYSAIFDAITAKEHVYEPYSIDINYKKGLALALGTGEDPDFPCLHIVNVNDLAVIALNSDTHLMDTLLEMAYWAQDGDSIVIVDKGHPEECCTLFQIDWDNNKLQNHGLAIDINKYDLEKLLTVSRSLTSYAETKEEEAIDAINEYRYWKFYSVLKNDNINPNYKKDNAYLIFYAIDTGYEWYVETLIEFGVNLSVKDHTRKSLLHFACKKGNVDTVKVLLNAGLDINALDNTSKTPLMVALEKGHNTIARTLVNEGADVNCIDFFSHSPLTYAAQIGKTGAVRLLLNNGANINHKIKTGENALDLAKLNDNNDIVQILGNFLCEK